MMQQIENLASAQADEARIKAAAFEKFCKSDVADQLKRRWIAWHELAPKAKRAGIKIPPDLVSDNEQMDRKTRRFAELIRGLDKQQFLLIMAESTDREGTITSLAIIHRAAAVKAGLLGAFQFLPVLWQGLKWAGGIAAFLAAIKAGETLIGIFNAWNEPQKLAEEAKTLHERNIAAAAKIVDDPQISPEIKAAYLDAVARASTNITNTTGPGFLDRVLGTTTAGFGGLAIGLILALMLGRRGR